MSMDVKTQQKMSYSEVVGFMSKISDEEFND